MSPPSPASAVASAHHLWDGRDYTPSTGLPDTSRKMQKGRLVRQPFLVVPTIRAVRPSWVVIVVVATKCTTDVVAATHTLDA
jgi:hypothetical protein